MNPLIISGVVLFVLIITLFMFMFYNSGGDEEDDSKRYALGGIEDASNDIVIEDVSKGPIITNWSDRNMMGESGTDIIDINQKLKVSNETGNEKPNVSRLYTVRITSGTPFGTQKLISGMSE